MASRSMNSSALGVMPARNTALTASHACVALAKGTNRSREARGNGINRRTALVMMPKVPPSVSLEHLHAVHVSVAEQAALLVKRLRESGEYSFRDLVADAESTLVIVARFLAVLELARLRLVRIHQTESGAIVLYRTTLDPTAEDLESVDA